MVMMLNMHAQVERKSEAPTKAPALPCSAAASLAERAGAQAERAESDQSLWSDQRWLLASCNNQQMHC